MKIVALVSGGKDSCYSMMECVRYGHEIACIAHLRPPSHLSEDQAEIDSFMFQSVGHNVVEMIAQCMEVPLVTEQITGKAVTTDIDYESRVDGDEVEDLYRLLHKVKQQFPEVQGVSSGAIFSTYQRNRVENVCGRLGLTSLGYLWRRDQVDLLSEMIQSRVEAILVKVASIGLKPDKHLGKTLGMLQPQLMELKDKYGMNVCGEGGEYETTTLDCPLFKKRIVIDESRIVMHSDDYFAPVAFLVIEKSHLEDKSQSERDEDVKALQLFTSDPSELFCTRPAVSPVRKAPSNADAAIASMESSSPLASLGLCRDQLYLSGISAGPRASQMSVTEEVRQVLQRAKRALGQEGMDMEDVCFVHLFVSDMALFGQINEEYCRHFGHSPASRSCVEVALSSSSRARVLMDCFAIRNSGVTKKNSESVTRNVLHVQSISSWAPTCIGPYSQANILHGALILLAGQIALFPSTMQVVGTTHLDQAHQCFVNICRVLESLKSNLRHVAIGVVYFVEGDGQDDSQKKPSAEEFTTFCRDMLVSNANMADEYEPEDRDSIYSSDDEDENREKLEKKHEERVRLVQHSPLLFAEVTGLPRNALVEIELQALTHGVLKSLEVQSDICERLSHCKTWTCEFQQTYAPRSLCLTIATAALVQPSSQPAKANVDTWDLESICADLVHGINQSLRKALCSWEKVLHLRVFYRQDVLDQLEVALALQKQLGRYQVTESGAQHLALTFIPTKSLQLNPLAVLSIQVTAQDLDKLETELWLRKQI